MEGCSEKGSVSVIPERHSIPYVVPFAVFLLLTGSVRFWPALAPFFYIAKTAVVGTLLWLWRRKYAADVSPGLSSRDWATAISCGLLVLVIWILPDGHFPQIGLNTGFDPFGFGWSKAAATALIAVRMLGAVIVVPVMEELFWRSFLMRYLINPDFRSVPMGSFTRFSFFTTAVLFGLEHHRVIEGIIAGILYNFLLTRQKKLKGVILAHAVTNFGLGIYVIVTESWMFW